MVFSSITFLCYFLPLFIAACLIFKSQHKRNLIPLSYQHYAGIYLLLYNTNIISYEKSETLCLQGLWKLIYKKISKFTVALQNRKLPLRYKSLLASTLILNNETAMMVRKITEILGQPKRDCIYDVISHLNLGLCVDVGAAAGHVTRKLCHVGGAQTRVVSFEPFPGNHQYFHQSTKNLNNKISLVKKAVSDSIGTAEFVVPSVGQGNEPGWEKYIGYSAVGFLSSISIGNAHGFVLSTQKYLMPRLQAIINTVLGRPRPQILKVKTTTIDMEFPTEEIDFMKIDVQGAEAQVLLGSLTMLQEKRIHILYIEWSGEQEVVEILANNGYKIYDSTYVIGPKIYDIQPFEEIGFQYVDEVSLSVGKTAYEMILVDDNISPTEAISEVKKRGLGWIQTDLIAISKNVEEQFLMATKQFSEEQANKSSKRDVNIPPVLHTSN